MKHPSPCTFESESAGEHLAPLDEPTDLPGGWLSESSLSIPPRPIQHDGLENFPSELSAPTSLLGPPDRIPVASPVVEPSETDRQRAFPPPERVHIPVRRLTAAARLVLGVLACGTLGAAIVVVGLLRAGDVPISTGPPPDASVSVPAPSTVIGMLLPNAGVAGATVGDTAAANPAVVSAPPAEPPPAVHDVPISPVVTRSNSSTNPPRPARRQMASSPATAAPPPSAATSAPERAATPTPVVTLAPIVVSTPTATATPPPTPAVITTAMPTVAPDPPRATVTPPPTPRPTATPAPTPAASPPEASAGVVRTASIQSVLDRYRNAFDLLDATAVKGFWPDADVRALSRAFAQLDSQRFQFDHCDIQLAGSRAFASCRGYAQVVKKAGAREMRQEPRQWTFTLGEVKNSWVILSVDARQGG